MHVYYSRSRNQEEVGQITLEAVSLCTLSKSLTYASGKGEDVVSNRPFSLGWFVFPLQTTGYSVENCSFMHLKIIYSYAEDYFTE